jgi:hypothetical protein
MNSTPSVRTELLAALTQLSQLRPDWRLGQTLANLATTAGRLDAGGVWDLEDEEALAAAQILIGECSETNSEPSAPADGGRDVAPSGLPIASRGRRG